MRIFVGRVEALRGPTQGALAERMRTGARTQMGSCSPSPSPASAVCWDDEQGEDRGEGTHGGLRNVNRATGNRFLGSILQPPLP